MGDVYRAGYPAHDGLARLQIVMDENAVGLADPLVVEAVTYNELAGGGTLGQIIPALRPRRPDVDRDPVHEKKDLSFTG